MRLAFLSVELENFKSFNGVHKFKFNDCAIGLHFMRGQNKIEPRLGSNGAGKSSIWDALTWCLYGRTPGGLRTPDLRPWSDAGATRARVAFRVGGELNVVERSTDPNKLTLNGRVVGQEQIEQVLQLDFSIITNTIILGQGQPLFFDLQPRNKMQLFVDVLKLDRWDARSQYASDRVAHLQGEERKAQTMIDVHRSTLEEVRAMIVTQKKMVDDWDIDRSQQLLNASRTRKQLERDYNSLNKKYELSQLKLDSAETEARALRDVLKANEKALMSATDKHNNAIVHERANQALLEGARVGLRELTATKNCPTCGQPVTSKHIAEHRNVAKKAIAQFEKIMVANEQQTNKTKSVVTACRKALETVRVQLSDFETKATVERDQIDYLQPRVSDLRAQLDVIKQTHDKTEMQDNPHLAQLRVFKKRVSTISFDLGFAESEIRKVTRLTSRNQYWIKGFKEIRLFMLEETLQDLQRVIRAMLQDVGLIGWDVTLDIERETKSGTIQPGINVMIKSPRSRDAVRWESWSGGEGQRLRIIGALALSEVLLDHAGVQTNIEVLDEPTQHISMTGIRDLCETLAERATKLQRKIFYVDHMTRENMHFASVINIIRDDQGSRIA